MQEHMQNEQSLAKAVVLKGWSLASNCEGMCKREVTQAKDEGCASSDRRWKMVL